MGLLDDLGKRVSDAGQKTLQKTKEISDIARINSLIAEEEKIMNNTYYQIGKLYVSVYGNNCGEEFMGMTAAAMESDQRIRDYRKQIQDIKGVQCCDKCGAEVARSAAFCSSCGNSMPKILETGSGDDFIRCEHCGASVKKEMRFCTSCGSAMKQAAAAVSTVQTPQTQIEKKICPTCGAELAGSSAFCIECGTKL